MTDLSEEPKTIWFFIKFFLDESHADQFMQGILYLNTLGYFKTMEEGEDESGRPDSTEGVAYWFQPKGMVLRLNIPGLGETVITEKDLARPISIAPNHLEYLNLLCMYSVHTSGFKFDTDGRINCSTDQVEQLRKQLVIDPRCYKFGNFAVVVRAPAFLDRLKSAQTLKKYAVSASIVKYYDESIFNGEIPAQDIPFRKQKRFSYQQEFRVAVNTGLQENKPLLLDIGDISEMSAKVHVEELSTLFDLSLIPENE